MRRNERSFLFLNSCFFNKKHLFLLCVWVAHELYRSPFQYSNKRINQRAAEHNEIGVEWKRVECAAVREAAAFELFAR